MIKALLLRRIWLLGNNLTSGIVILFLFPLTIFIFTNLAFRKIPVVGIYDVDFDIWIYPSMIFLVTGLSILPSIFRDVFDLRVHKKVLSYLSLSPYSKRYMIFSFSIVSLVESIIIGFVAVILFSSIGTPGLFSVNPSVLAFSIGIEYFDPNASQLSSINHKSYFLQKVNISSRLNGFPSA